MTPPTAPANAPVYTQEQKDAILLGLKTVVPGYIDELVEQKLAEAETKRAAKEVANRATTNHFGALLGRQDKELASGSVNKSLTFGMVCAAMMAGGNAMSGRAQEKGFDKFRGNDARDSALKYTESMYGENSEAVAAVDVAIKRSLSAGEMGDGGQFITGDVRSTWTDILTPAVAFLKLGPTLFSMPSGTGEAPRVGSDVSATFIGEVAEPTITKPSFAARMLSAKKLAAMIAISNTLIRRGGPAVAQEVQRLAVRRMGITADMACIRGVGGDFSPRGLFNLAGSTATATASPTFAQVLSDLGNMILKLQQANVPMQKLGWLFAPRTGNFLGYQVVTALGIPYFQRELAEGQLLGFDYATTTNVATNLGAGNESWTLLADFASVIYGETLQLAVNTSMEASYTEGGVIKNCFARDETLMVLRQEFDIAVEHAEAVTTLTQQTWGG